jgi:hypothetical protein
VSGKTAGGRWEQRRQKAGYGQWAIGGLGLSRELWVQHFNDKGYRFSSFAFAWSRAWKD